MASGVSTGFLSGKKKRGDDMKLFFAYLKAAKKKIFLSAVCALTAAVVLRLFQLPLPPIFYTLALCAFLGLMAMILQFRQFRKKHLLLQTFPYRTINSKKIIYP